MEHKVLCSNLKIGMYVSNLDRPWLDTPFLVQGFFIHEDREIMALKQYCDYVYIETDRGLEAEFYMDENPGLPTHDYLERYLKHRHREIEYPDATTVKHELAAAKIALDETRENIGHIINTIKSSAKSHLHDLQRAIDPLLESVLRNPEAMLWLIRVEQDEAYANTHSINSAVLAIAFGRYMGLPREDLYQLAVGMLLLDIGNTNVSSELLSKKAQLTDNEFKAVKEHVQYSVEIIKTIDGLGEDVINMVLTHHERFDGSGYPNALVGNAIPIYGRIAAIVDCYDAMISWRPYSTAISPTTALQKIYNWRTSLFQRELVDQFLQCLGLYPTGSLVEFNNGEVGIVLSQNPGHHLKPNIMLLLDKHKCAYDNFPVIDLRKPPHSQQTTRSILRGLDPGAYGIQPGELFV